MGKYHYVITLAWNTLAGTNAQGTASGLFTPIPGATRSEAFQHIYRTTQKDMRISQENPTVLFFSLEPDAVL